MEIDEIVLGLPDDLVHVDVEAGLLLELPDVELGLEAGGVVAEEAFVQAEEGLEMPGELVRAVLPELGEDDVMVGRDLAEGRSRGRARRFIGRGRVLGGGREGQCNQGRRKGNANLLHDSPSSPFLD